MAEKATSMPGDSVAPASIDRSEPQQLNTNDAIVRTDSVDFRDDPEKPQLHESSVPGVAKVERFSHVLYQSGKSGRMLLYILVGSIGLTMIAYAFDQGITSQFTVIAASSFSHHAEIGAVNTAASIIRAVSKPFLGKLSDITSRPTCYVIVLVFYIIGFVVAATCNDIAAYTIGISFTAFGKSGLDLLSDIIVGDLTPLEWRAFWSGLLSTPFIVTVFINGFIADGMIPDHWRWGLGMFAIMMPVLLIPAILTLYGVQRRADKLKVISFGESGMTRREGVKVKSARHYMALAWKGIVDIDLAGLVLLGTAFALILLSFNLTKSASGGWSNPSMIAMLVVGFVILAFFVLFEVFLAPKPIMTRRMFNNRALMCALLVDTTSQMASATRNNYFSSYIFVTKDWTNYVWTVFLGVTTVVLCLVSPIGGLIHRYTHRYKSLMVFGAVAKCVGNAILLTGALRSTQNTAALVVSQILLGFGSFQVIGARVGSQASVPHDDLSSVIAILSLWSTLGSSVGYTIAASIWTGNMLPYMREEMPEASEKTLRTIYGSIKILRKKYDWADPVRQGAIRAYTRTNGVIFLTVVVLNIVPIVCSLLMPDYYLGKQQNAVTNTDVAGQPVEIEKREEDAEKKNNLVGRLKSLYYKET
ncbi:MFS general substrate transporter [Karstenula rhodostoma CBS 690.94]|uniref:MFS general substrate transporter n=1 Tax=Karstenula rhodostoma CBS 690.94 TaxID=1392251 RepID=A0A9P4PV28_9PLEO|nr:MFS general substrate transporter [Karstenula rhodostoma CBS 690.94]